MHGLGAFTNSGEAEATLDGRADAGGSEAFAVVAHHEAHVVGEKGQFKIDLGRASMPRGIGDGLLTNSQEIVLHLGRERAGSAVDA